MSRGPRTLCTTQMQATDPPRPARAVSRVSLSSSNREKVHSLPAAVRYPNRKKTLCRTDIGKTTTSRVSKRRRDGAERSPRPLPPPPHRSWIAGPGSGSSTLPYRSTNTFLATFTRPQVAGLRHSSGCASMRCGAGRRCNSTRTDEEGRGQSSKLRQTFQLVEPWRAVV